MLLLFRNVGDDSNCGVEVFRCRCLCEYDFLSVISLEEGRSYLYCDGAETLTGLERLFSEGKSQKNLLVLDDFVLRKEILRRGIELGG